jgi:hypothetical protein
MKSKLSKPQEKVIKALKKIRKEMKKMGYNSGRGAIFDELVREGVSERSLWRSVMALERKGRVTLIHFPDFTEVRLSKKKQK